MSKECFVVRSGESKNELKHWKYIKREKRPNGKWRYYYDVKDMLGYDEKAEFEKANKIYKNAQKEAEVKEKNANDWYNNAAALADAKGNYDPNTGELKLSKDTIDYSKELYKSADDAKRRAEYAGKIASNAAIAYNKTPLGKLENFKSDLERGSDWLKKKLGIH